MDDNDVAIAIDYENLYYSIRNTYEAYPNLEQIVETGEKYGRVASKQAFADWTVFSKSLQLLLRTGIQPVFCPSAIAPNQRTRGKSSVDTIISVNIMKLFFTTPNIKTLILVSGDRDFIPLIVEIKQMGKQIIVLSIASSMSSDLSQIADDVVIYEDIVKDLVPRKPELLRQRVDATADPYPILLEEIKLARKEKKATVLAYLKIRLKDRIMGFDETVLKDSSGRSIRKFKDFINEAAAKGLVKVHTMGTVNEVFLPNENPVVLTHFKNLEKTTPLK